MKDPAWAHGYVVDLAYTRHYFRELSPVHLDFVALVAGLEAADPAETRTYIELGCGNGTSLALHAATHPHLQFQGVDFNPTHIRAARRLAARAGLANVTFLEKSFEELLAEHGPEADYITLHGVWSWVGPGPRRQIVEFLRRRLRPGGLAYVSYNCLPGLAPLLPLRRLAKELADQCSGSRADRVRAALAEAGRLSGHEALFFQQNPMALKALAEMEGKSTRYLAHEYFNAHWQPEYHLDVAADLAEAKLEYAGSASIIENFTDLILSPELARCVNETVDPSLAETIKDYATNQPFRRDVFSRGCPKATPARLEAGLAATRFCLLRPRSACGFEARLPGGQLSLRPEAYWPVLEALSRTPLTVAELMASPECEGLDELQLRQALFGMAALRNVAPALPVAGEALRRQTCERFNRVLLESDEAGAAVQDLASPVLGAGVAIDPIDQLFLRAGRDETAAFAAVLTDLRARGLHPGDADSPEGESLETFVARRCRFFFTSLLPFLRLVGISD
jgi:SAM-dependent methyltransferase